MKLSPTEKEALKSYIDVYGNRIVEVTLQFIKTGESEEARNKKYQLAGEELIKKIDLLCG